MMHLMVLENFESWILFCPRKRSSPLKTAQEKLKVPLIGSDQRTSTPRTNRCRQHSTRLSPPHCHAALQSNEQEILKMHSTGFATRARVNLTPPVLSRRLTKCCQRRRVKPESKEHARLKELWTGCVIIMLR